MAVAILHLMEMKVVVKQEIHLITVGMVILKMEPNAPLLHNGGVWILIMHLKVLVPLMGQTVVEILPLAVGLYVKLI